MLYPKRDRNKTRPEDMVEIDINYVRSVVRGSGINQSELSLRMGYCLEYLSNSIHDGRMQKRILKALSDELGFPYNKALKKQRKSRKK